MEMFEERGRQRASGGRGEAAEIGYVREVDPNDLES